MIKVMHIGSNRILCMAFVSYCLISKKYVLFRNKLFNIYIQLKKQRVDLILHAGLLFEK